MNRNFFRNFFRNFSGQGQKPSDEAERSVFFWKALIQVAEKDIEQASRLRDCGLLVSAMERHDLAERRLKQISQD
jgi:hypothetical protein